MLSLPSRAYRAAKGGERACNSHHISPRKCLNSNMRCFSNVSNSCIWKRGLQSGINLLYHVWMWFTTRCTCKFSMHKRCIAINGVTNFRYRGPCLNFDVHVRCMPSPTFGGSVRPYYHVPCTTPCAINNLTYLFFDVLKWVSPKLKSKQVRDQY